MKKVIIFGGTGFIGTAMAEHLSKNNFHPIVIGRNKKDARFEFFQWDGINEGAWAEQLNNAYAVVNLVG